MCKRKYRRAIFNFHLIWECGRKIRCQYKICLKHFTSVRALQEHMKRTHKSVLVQSAYAKFQRKDSQEGATLFEN